MSGAITNRNNKIKFLPYLTLQVSVIGIIKICLSSSIQTAEISHDVKKKYISPWYDSTRVNPQWYTNISYPHKKEKGQIKHTDHIRSVCFKLSKILRQKSSNFPVWIKSYTSSILLYFGLFLRFRYYFMLSLTKTCMFYNKIYCCLTLYINCRPVC